MCGRFLLTAPGNLVQVLFQLDDVPDLRPRYNIAPTQDVAVVRERDGVRGCDMLRWGLVPSWAKDPAIGNRMINARCETASQKPSFRAAMRRRRCLIAADGFYEWQPTGEGSRKQPWVFRMPDEGVFGMAGLWESWAGPAGEEGVLETCTILTTAANSLVAPVHQRMPVILEPAHHERWLDTSCCEAPQVEAMLDAIDFGSPLPSDAMIGRVVSRHVNRPGNDDPGCLAEPD